MSFLSNNVIPGNHGMTFGTDAKVKTDLERIKNRILKLKGIKDVIIDVKIFPREFTVHTSKIIKIEDIEEEVKLVGFHAIPKTPFGL